MPSRPSDALIERVTPKNDNYSLTLSDVAAIADRDERTVRRWTEVGRGDRGRLPAVHALNGLRFKPEDVDEYLRPRPVAPRGGPRPSDIEIAIAAGKAAGEKLAETPLTEEQKALLGTLVNPLTIMATKSTSISGGASA